MKGAAAAALAALLALPLIVVVLVLGATGGGQATASPTTPAALNLAGPVSGKPGQLQALAARLATGYGWTGQQDTCLDELWTRESGWSAIAINPSSGAYGVAQALGHVPGVSVAQNREGYNYPPPYTAGNPAPWGDSDATAQISWGLQYIHGAYGTPCGAWAHEEADGFY